MIYAQMFDRFPLEWPATVAACVPRPHVRLVNRQMRSEYDRRSPRGSSLTMDTPDLQRFAHTTLRPSYLAMTRLVTAVFRILIDSEDKPVHFAFYKQADSLTDLKAQLPRIDTIEALLKVDLEECYEGQIDKYMEIVHDLSEILIDTNVMHKLKVAS
jgi:hypothetical protein